jgi:hypothetical protein
MFSVARVGTGEEIAGPSAEQMLWRVRDRQERHANSLTRDQDHDRDRHQSAAIKELTR